MDQRVLPAKTPDGEPGSVKILAGGHAMDPRPGVGRLIAQLGRDSGRRIQLQGRPGQQCGSDGVDVDVVGMFVGDQHHVGAGEGLVGLREVTRIEHQHLAVLLEPDAGVRELCQQHQASLGSRPGGVHAPGW
jgi:hypothetical protein